MNLKVKKILIMVVIAVVVVVAGFYFWNRLRLNDKSLVSGNGRIEATEIDVSAKLAGRVINIFVDEGDFVEPGQLLVQMQVDVLEAQRDEAKAVVAQRESELDAAQRRLVRTEALAKEGAASIQELDDDRANARSAQAALVAAEATVTRVEAEITDSALKAPCSGRIQYRIAQIGEVLGAGGKALNMVDLSDVYMTFFLPEHAAGRVSIGAEARIVLDAAPEYVIPAKISFVASTAQFTPKTVETSSERQKLMFRAKAQISRELLLKYPKYVKTGLPGVAWIKLDSLAQWPNKLKIKILE
ncbi:MAG TPA: efflux RND transporter periplasmic adaptor subunit [Candidatus Omnitrophota bacterium]|nr:efflux RND transporter periplasmic adaptor subunit [Candidatus Omnitrophota bacterium]HPT39096.1 efflux RND transporter periplasmic adaptor subunit [Candidatus Omnitrophota bacterium]